jgi:mannitol/fructose-specific phosphotransferase system IIA component (Ntr-type)
MSTPVRSAQGFAQRFKLQACCTTLAASTKEDTLREMADLIAASGQITARQVRPLHAQFLARERLASTGVGAGVAIPHVKLEGLKETALAFAVHPAGVEWAALDGEVVHLVFAVVRPAESGEFHDPKRHLELMQWIAHLSRAHDFRRFALAAASPKVLHELLSEVESA